MRRPITVALAVCLSVAAFGQGPPAGFVVDHLLTTGLTDPNDLCFLPDGRCLVANAAGSIVVRAGAAAAVIGTVPAVQTGGEQGLLSLVADPAFATNGHVYVLYSSTADAFMHVDRFTCIGDLANPASVNLQLATTSRRVVLATPNVSPYHNGGAVRFGPDGMLFVGLGDDTNDCSAQDVTSGCGCLLRVDVAALPAGGSLVLPSPSVLDPGDNPLSASSDFRQLVVAYGLRNPFRFEVDPVTSNVYIGDVGADAVEELSEYVYTPGALQLVNFGWPWREGTQPHNGCVGTPPPNLVDPIRTDHHNNGWLTVIGGPRYRNLGGANDFGPAYEGHVFLTDHWLGELRRLVPGAAPWGIAPPVQGQPTPWNWADNLIRISSLRLGPDGALWFTSYYPGTGVLGRVRPSSSVVGVHAISGSAQRGPAGETFPQPVVARVYDNQGNPLAGGAIDFAAIGGTLSTTNPVLADGNGYAQTNVTAATAGGHVRVTATNLATATTASFQLFGRKLAIANPPNQLLLQIDNQTSVIPPFVPYVVLVSFPGSPSVASPIGTLCIDPAYALAIVIEDGIGAVGGVSFSGAPAIGTPGLVRSYPLPPGLLTGFLMSFQALGFDLQTGWFRTNCEQLQFSTSASDGTDAAAAAGATWTGPQARLLVATTLLALAVRLLGIEQWSWNGAEARTWAAVTRPWWGDGGLFTSEQGLTPFVYVGLRALLAVVANHGEGWLRLPFAFAGTLAVPLLAVVARRWLGARWALVAAVLLALHPQHVGASQTAAGGIVASTLVLAAGAVATRRHGLVWVALAAAAATVVVAWVVLAAAVALRFRPRAWPAVRWPLALLAAAGGVLALPLATWPVLLLATLGVALQWPRAAALPVAALLVPAALAAVFVWHPATHGDALLLALPAMVGFAAAGARALFAAALQTQHRAPHGVTVGAALPAALTAVWLAAATALQVTVYGGDRAPWRPAAAIVWSGAAPGAVVVVGAGAGAAPLACYLRPSQWRDAGSDPHPARVVLPFDPAEPAAYAALAARPERHLRLALREDEVRRADAVPATRDALRGRFALERVAASASARGGASVHVFRRADER